MTLKEQIMKLQTYKMHEGEDTVYVEREDVLKALEKQLCEDTISRAEVQTAIEMSASRYTIAKERGGIGQVEWSDQLIKVSDAVDIIRHLSSVKLLEQQSCYNPDEWCHDCSEYNQDKHCCPRYNKVIRNTVEEMKQPCEDAISKQAVLDAIAANCIWENEYNLTSSRIKKAVEGLPPVTPQPQTGQWVLLDECSNSGYYCSYCHKKLVKEGWSGTVKKIKFCPNCGCRLVEPQESEAEDAVIN